jgi:ArsR family transcriptional regulator, arsenate/arsenite/antimonite-responsive transcriptional repressor
MPAPRPSVGRLLDLTACCAPLAVSVPDDDESARLAAAFRALGDPVRLRLLGILMTAPGGEVCACDLALPLDRSQPTVSHHLKVLREAGLVSATRRGTNIVYTVRTDQLAALQAVLAPDQPQPRPAAR